MTTKSSLVALIVIAIIAIGGYTYPHAKEAAKDQSLGAFPGPTVTEAMEFLGGVVFGKANATSTTATTYTLLARDIVGFDTVLITPNTGDLTVTLPASSTLANLVPKAGMRTRQCWHNATTTAGIDITFAAGLGLDLETASSSPTDLTLLADEFACFEFVRKPRTASAFDIGVLMTEYTNGD